MRSEQIELKNKIRHREKLVNQFNEKIHRFTGEIDKLTKELEQSSLFAKEKEAYENGKQIVTTLPWVERWYKIDPISAPLWNPSQIYRVLEDDEELSNFGAIIKKEKFAKEKEAHKCGKRIAFRIDKTHDWQLVSNPIWDERMEYIILDDENYQTSVETFYVPDLGEIVKLEFTKLHNQLMVKVL
jgi:hypothetical protein